MVVVEILRDRDTQQQIERLEVHYLASQDGDLRFALLSDWADSATEPVPGDEERILVDDTPRGEILAPPQLEDIKGAKAVYVRGRAMEPRYYAGEVVYLHPTRPPNPGDFVFIVVQESGFPAAIGYIRQFVGSDLVSIRVSTLNPRRQELIPRQAVVEIATVVGSGLF